MVTESAFQRLVRFISSDGNIYYGDAILPHGQTDARFAKEARLISGDVLATYNIEKTIMVRL
jgi:hypothetical protein